MKHIFACVLALATLAGCARSPVVPEPQAPLARILVAPVAPIDKLYTENKGVPLGILWQSLADRIKSSAFTEHMEETRKRMGDKLAAALVRHLQAEGFEARLAPAAPGQPMEPATDESALPPTDALLRIYLSEVGMSSARFSMDYVPRLNLSASLTRGGSEDSIYSETLYYGADADAHGKASWSVPADPAHRWPSFSALLERSDEVVQSYDAAVDALAKRIAQNIRAQVEPAQVRAAAAS